MKKISICILLTLITINPVKTNSEPVTIITSIVGSASVGATLQGISGLVEDSIDKAQNTGDYLLFKSATELKSVISTWESANQNLLDKTFNELNESQRIFFNNINATANQLNSNVENHLETATRIAELANQSVQDIRIFDGGLGLFRYSPRIVYSGIPEDVTFIIRGVNFDKADPKLVLPSGGNANRVSLTRQEAVFVFSKDEFKFNDIKAEFTNLKLEYLAPSDSVFGKIKDTFRGRKTIKSANISILQLPNNLGNYSLTYKTKESHKEIWSGERQFHHSGRNSSATFNQGPHDNNWKMIISSLGKAREWGRAGKGCSVVTNNEYGFSIKIQVGVIRELFNPNAPGYQHCIYRWQEFTEYQQEKEFPELNGRLKWEIDSAIALPENLKSFKLNISTWDGKTRVFNGSASETFYKIDESKDLLIIKPQIPKDLNSF